MDRGSKSPVAHTPKIRLKRLDTITLKRVIRSMARKRSPKAGWNAQMVYNLRRHLGSTQQQLAGTLGTRQQTISEWETGMYRPRGASVTVLNIIAERAEFVYRADSGVNDSERPT